MKHHETVGDHLVASVLRARPAEEAARRLAERGPNALPAALRGALDTPAVLIALAVVTAAQFAFTYAPFMHAWFGTRSVSLADGLPVLAPGVALLEGEKWLLRRLGVKDLQQAA